MSNRIMRICRTRRTLSVLVTSMFVIVFCCVAFSLNRNANYQGGCRNAPPDGFNSPSRVSYRGRYVNQVFKYSITIPPGLVGYSAAPPSPLHGFGIVLGTEGDGYFWTEGRTNALDLSLQELAQSRIDSLREKGVKVLSHEQNSWKLDIFPAIRTIIQYSCMGRSEVFTHDSVVAMDSSKSTTWILVLDSKRMRYPEYRKIFDPMLKSWKYRPQLSY